MDKKQEKDELMEKVFGKNAPKRTLSAEDIALLKTNPFTGEQISEELEQLKKNSEKLQKESQSILDMMNGTPNSNIEALDSLNQSLKTDFAQFNLEEESSLNIVYDQESLNTKFNDIENKLKETVFCQDNYISGLSKAFRRPFVMGQQPSGLKNAILITGPKDSGRHTGITTIAKLLKQNELLTNDSITVLDIDNYQSKDDENNFIVDLYGAINNSNIIVFDNIQDVAASYLALIEEILMEGKMSLAKRYVLNNKQLVETTNTLAKNTIKELSFKGKYIIFTTSLKTSKLLNTVGSRFINNISDSITTNAISKENLFEILPKKFKELENKCNENLNIKFNYDESFNAYLQANYDGSNMKYLNELFEDLYNGLSEFKLQNPTNSSVEITLFYKDELYFNEEKVSTYLPVAVNNVIEECKKELDQLVGLTEVKEYIYGLQDFYAAQALRKAQGLSTTEISKHMIFTGNPGTGKTTIARLLAKYLKAIGVLSNGQLIEVSRSDLVGKYVGHTAPLTMQVIKSAVGGILFIDEAYSLYRGDNDSFGLEAIDTLVKAMEDNREDLIVILAGYTKEMSYFLESNSGLQSRFPNQIEFPDYTGDELYQIACINAKSAGYKIDETAKEAIVNHFAKIQASDSVRSGNGRLSRNLVEEAIVNQSKRLAKDKNAQIDILLLEDFDLA